MTNFGTASGSETGTVTRLLRAVDAGEDGASDDLFGRVQHDLRRLAQSMLQKWPRSALTTNGTELVNVACVRLLAAGKLSANNRRQFFRLLGRAMHDVLVEEARRVGAAKRGGDWKRRELDDAPDFADDEEPQELRDLRVALEELGRVDADAAMVVRLRFFADRSFRETARILGRSLHDVRSDWHYAKAWLTDRLGER